MKLRYCKKCLQPDSRPGVVFDEEGVCYACRYEESKKGIDWRAREEELREIAEEAKEKSRKKGIPYDCVIGVSGGKDSTFQAVYAKEKLGLHPLLVNCSPATITEVGTHNIQNLNHLGFDIITLHLDPNIAKDLARETFLDRGNIVAASEFCLWASAYIMADKFDIDLIIQGENAALTLGTAAQQDTSGDAFNVVQLNTLRQGLKGLLGDQADKYEDSMYFYYMPDFVKMKERGVRAIWLQYYTKEWSQVYNADFSVARGIWGRSREDLHDIGRYRRYMAVDDDLQIPNQMIKYLKFGFGATTDEVCYDIREGRLTREEGIWLVNEYDGKCGQQYIRMACDYMGISEEQFWEVVDRYVNQELFRRENGKWVPRFTVGEDYDSEKQGA